MLKELVRTRLYSLQPKGIQTSFVESLSSYLIRLAEVHVIHLGDLLAYEIAPVLGKQYLLNSIDRGGNRFYDGARTINGIEKNAEDMVVTLENLTGLKNLEVLTLLRFKKTFPVRNLLRKSLAWCPKCLEEMKEKDFLYYPLIWCFTAYKVCSNHKIHLEEKCPHCSKFIPFLHRKSRVGICSYCHFQLYKSLNILPCIEPKDYSISESIESFFEEVDKGKLLSIDTLYENLLFILHEGFNGNIQQLANYIGIPKTTVWGWINKEVTPPLNKVLDIAYIFDTSATVLYAHHEELQVNINALVKNGVKAIKERGKFNLDYKKIYLYLNEVEKKQVDVKTIIDIAKELNCSTKFLYTNFPESCKKISYRNCQIKTEKQLVYIESLKKEIQETCTFLFYQNIFPTTRLLEGELGLPFLFKNRKMKDYFYKVRFELENQINVRKDDAYAARK